MGYFTGVVRDVREHHELGMLANICYEDEDSEDMTLEEMKRILINGDNQSARRAGNSHKDKGSNVQQATVTETGRDQNLNAECQTCGCSSQVEVFKAMSFIWLVSAVINWFELKFAGKRRALLYTQISSRFKQVSNQL